MKINSGAEELFLVLAAMSDAMGSIASLLGKNSSCKYAKSGCDVRRFEGSSADDRYDYEAYVEAEMLNENVYSWSANLTLDSKGWRFQRVVEKRERDGGHAIQSFDDIMPADIRELLISLSALLDELVQTAKQMELLESLE